MKRTEDYNAMAWGHESILNYFDKKRLTTDDIYPSEWFFIRQKMAEGIRVLDIGCAKGGLANVMTEHLQDFTYVGVDINEQMIAGAKKRYPNHEFHHVKENDFSVLGNQSFDLVICLGILHLHESWRNTIKTAWSHTKHHLILDLRETHLMSIENKDIAYFKMDFDNVSVPSSDYILPYNIINSAEALAAIMDLCPKSSKISHYGYTHTVSDLAVCPLQNIMANVYCIER